MATLTWTGAVGDGDMDNPDNWEVVKMESWKTLTWDQLIKFADSDYRQKFCDKYRDQTDTPTIDEHSKEFPGAELGDILYAYDITIGTTRAVVTRCLSGGYVLIVRVSDSDGALTATEHVAGADWFESEEEAVQFETKGMIQYCEDTLKFCRAARRAADGGKSLKRFAEGHCTGGE